MLPQLLQLLLYPHLVISQHVQLTAETRVQLTQLRFGGVHCSGGRTGHSADVGARASRGGRRRPVWDRVGQRTEIVILLLQRGKFTAALHDRLAISGTPSVQALSVLLALLIDLLELPRMLLA